MRNLKRMRLLLLASLVTLLCTGCEAFGWLVFGLTSTVITAVWVSQL